MTAAEDLARFIGDRKFGAILADPPWQFENRTGKVAPEHRRLCRYPTMPLREILDLPVADAAAEKSHLYLWVPNALLPDGLTVMEAWGFAYKSNIVWQKIRKDGGPDGRGVGFYFRNATELLLFGIRGGLRTLAPARSRVNVISSRKQEHSRKPEEQYELIEACSPGPWLELFARGAGGPNSERLAGVRPIEERSALMRPGWTFWGDQAERYEITWNTYRNNSGAAR